MVGAERGQAMIEAMVVMACATLAIGLALAAAGSGILARADALDGFYRLPFP